MQNAIAAKTKELDGIIAEAGLMSTATNIISVRLLFLLDL